MIPNVAVYFVSSLLISHLVEANPVSSLQSLKQLLDAERNAPYLRSEETDVGGKDLTSENADFKTGALSDWDDSARSAPMPENENALARLLNDIISSPKRSWSRFKKGGLRSCFGVRLERIGSFSGLGC